jgi:hypothetical protein
MPVFLSHFDTQVNQYNNTRPVKRKINVDTLAVQSVTIKEAKSPLDFMGE